MFVCRVLVLLLWFGLFGLFCVVGVVCCLMCVVRVVLVYVVCVFVVLFGLLSLCCVVLSVLYGLCDCCLSCVVLVWFDLFCVSLAGRLLFRFAWLVVWSLFCLFGAWSCFVFCLLSVVGMLLLFG